jgi:hypothetical protein
MVGGAVGLAVHRRVSGSVDYGSCMHCQVFIVRSALLFTVRRWHGVEMQGAGPSCMGVGL